MKRRNFIKATAASGIGATSIATAFGAVGGEPGDNNSAKFKLKYAPGIGVFREHAGADPIDNIKFIADQGFRAVFDNGFMNKEPALQEKLPMNL